MSKESELSKEIKVIGQMQIMSNQLNRQLYTTIKSIQKFKDFDVSIAPYSLSEIVLLKMQALITKYQLLMLQRKPGKEYSDAD